MGRKAKARRTRVGVGKGFGSPCTVKGRGYLVPSIIPGEEPSPRFYDGTEHPHVPTLCNSRGLQAAKRSRSYESQPLRTFLRVRKNFLEQTDAFLRLDVHSPYVDQRQSARAMRRQLPMSRVSLFCETDDVLFLEEAFHRHSKQIVVRLDVDGEVGGHTRLMRCC